MYLFITKNKFSLNLQKTKAENTLGLIIFLLLLYMWPDQLNILSDAAEEAGTPNTFFDTLAKSGHLDSKSFQNIAYSYSLC